MQDSRSLWNTMPGWGITANLLPPEVIHTRRVRVIRKRMVALSILAILLCVAGYGLAMVRTRSAEHAVTAELSRTAGLLHEQQKYAQVAQIQGTTAQVQTQIAGFMTNDVDFAALTNSLHTDLLPGMALTQLTIDLPVVKANLSGQTAAAAAVGGLDTSGQAHIGVISLTGTAAHISDVSSYVDKLNQLPGLVDVFPTSNQSDGKSVKFTIQVALTSALLTHKYVSKPGGK